MRKILLAIVIFAIAFSLMNQVGAGISLGSFGSSYAGVRDSVYGWFSTAAQKGKDLKASWDIKLQQATDKYNALKKEFDDLNSTLQTKKAELEKSLKDIEEAKKSVDQLINGGKPQ